jgi:hypothetical protein
MPMQLAIAESYVCGPTGVPAGGEQEGLPHPRRGWRRVWAQAPKTQQWSEQSEPCL